MRRQGAQRVPPVPPPARVRAPNKKEHWVLFFVGCNAEPHGNDIPVALTRGGAPTFCCGSRPGIGCCFLWHPQSHFCCSCCLSITFLQGQRKDERVRPLTTMRLERLHFLHGQDECSVCTTYCKSATGSGGNAGHGPSVPRGVHRTRRGPPTACTPHLALERCTWRQPGAA